jgi:hypothetical protein
MQTRSFFISLLIIVVLPVLASEKPVRLVSLDAEVRIVGFMAQTTMTMQFVNPNRRVMAGELYFPLPESRFFCAL